MQSIHLLQIFKYSAIYCEKTHCLNNAATAADDVTKMLHSSVLITFIRNAGTFPKNAIHISVKTPVPVMTILLTLWTRSIALNTFSFVSHSVHSTVTDACTHVHDQVI